MIIKDIQDFDIVNYKKPSMTIIMPFCDFKCDKENGNQYCQNWPLIKQPNIEIESTDLIRRYYNPQMVQSVVFCGLEPFCSWKDLYEFIYVFRQQYTDDIVVYSGYTKSEIEAKIQCLSDFPDIIIKFGRYRPHQKPHFDDVLGVSLASDNQYAERIS